MTDIEHLGQLATDEDLAAYEAAVDRVVNAPEFDFDREVAEEFVWNGGAILFGADVCLYCESVVVDGTLVPHRDDSEKWNELATEHDPACEWITTRAHQR